MDTHAFQCRDTTHLHRRVFSSRAAPVAGRKEKKAIICLFKHIMYFYKGNAWLCKYTMCHTSIRKGSKAIHWPWWLHLSGTNIATSAGVCASHVAGRWWVMETSFWAGSLATGVPFTVGRGTAFWHFLMVLDASWFVKDPVNRQVYAVTTRKAN